MAMTLNELATNASKYGSLSSPAGKVTLRWTLELPAGIDAPTLRIDWQERSGPAVTPPRRRGLGIDLIEGAIVYQLTGKVEFRFPPEGLECSVAVSLVSEDKAPGHAAVGAVR
jgi:two-component system CheB/CheR fusion protein